MSFPLRKNFQAANYICTMRDAYIFKSSLWTGYPMVSLSLSEANWDTSIKKHHGFFSTSLIVIQCLQIWPVLTCLAAYYTDKGMK